MRPRTLRLAKESLAPLGPTALRGVVAAGSGIDCIFADSYGPDCWNDISFERCPEPITLPIEQCI